MHAYEFKGKPGAPQRRPQQWAPYHLRLDWLMWFLPLRAMVSERGVFSGGHPVWFLRLVAHLFSADAATLSLLRSSPLGGQPPSHIRASLYSYALATRAERSQAGVYWRRRYVGEYLPALSRRAHAKAP